MFKLEPLLVALAAEFKRRDMHKHVVQLRRFYALRRRHLLAQAKADPAAWDDDLVLGWLALLRVPPFDHVYEVLEAGAPCPCGAQDTARAFTEAVFPGGALWRCLACGRSWLVVEPR